VITRDGSEVDAIDAAASHAHDTASTHITVTMQDDATVVVRPVGRLDADAVATVHRLLDSAAHAGTVAVLDVSAVDRRDHELAAELLASSRSFSASSVA